MSIRNTYKRNHYIYTLRNHYTKTKRWGGGGGGGGKSTMLASGVFFFW